MKMLNYYIHINNGKKNCCLSCQFVAHLIAIDLSLHLRLVYAKDKLVFTINIIFSYLCQLNFHQKSFAYISIFNLITLITFYFDLYPFIKLISSLNLHSSHLHYYRKNE